MFDIIYVSHSVFNKNKKKYYINILDIVLLTGEEVYYFLNSSK